MGSNRRDDPQHDLTSFARSLVRGRPNGRIVLIASPPLVTAPVVVNLRGEVVAKSILSLTPDS
jgi:hypothetical protein